MTTSLIQNQISHGVSWFDQNNWTPFSFQLEAWEKYLQGHSGLINAPTGFGKTYSLLVPILIESTTNIDTDKNFGFKAIWIAPIRALAKEIQLSCERALKGLQIPWRVEVRSGDTSSEERKRQLQNPPDILITTPESLHILFATKGYVKYFRQLNAIVVDEWHELMGSKRGVQVELAVSRLRAIRPNVKIWGISATIQNIDQALEILLGSSFDKSITSIIRSKVKKHITVETVIPDEIEEYPWAGHLGIRLLEKVVKIIARSKTTIIFTNTRSQCEIWYQRLLDADPSLAGAMAMHHGSINRSIRDWVEEALHEGRLKAVVSTSSLDLGVDFRPVESIVQVGSPKGVSRFIQRAGRSGHQPLAISRIYFVPTHSLELIEGAALRSAINEGVQEPRIPFIRSFDVLVQYLLTLAVSDGFHAPTVYQEIKTTHCFESISEDEWAWILRFLVSGGTSLEAYDQYRKVVRENNLYKVIDRRIAQRHRMSIGTIVSDASLNIAFTNGKRIGTIEEYFISSLNPGDVFWFAGQALELVRVKDMTAQVKRSKKKTGRVPSWGGGRMSLSSKLSAKIREKLHNFSEGLIDEVETEVLIPLLNLQHEKSSLIRDEEFLVEYIVSKDGYHLVMYPIEGRAVHQGMAALVAQRIAQRYSITFSIAMNDYGFELLSDRPFDTAIITKDLFSTKNLLLDIQNSMNSVEMARRKFRDVAKISGLIWQGFPGQRKKERHLQSSSSLLFDVFKTYEPDNLLFQQTYEEVMTFQFEESRLREALGRIGHQRLVITQPEGYTPFSFPIIVDRLSRERLSSEPLKDRVKRLIASTTR